MIPENTELLARITAGEATRDEIKVDLRTRCAEIPPGIWFKWHPDNLMMGLFEDMESELLPHNDSHDIGHWSGRPPGMRHTVGHDMVGIKLGRNGTIFEVLVHYNSDGYDSDKRYPDEVLGEASAERYRESYGSAVRQLDHLLEVAREVGAVYPGV